MSEMLASGLVTQNMVLSTDSYTIVSQIWEIAKDTALPIIAIVLILENATNFYRAAKNRASTVKRVAG